MEQLSKIYLLKSEAVLLGLWLQIEVANHRFSRWRENRYVLWREVRHNTICADLGGVCTNSTAIARKLIKVFCQAFFQKSDLSTTKLTLKFPNSLDNGTAMC